MRPSREKALQGVRKAAAAVKPPRNVKVSAHSTSKPGAGSSVGESNPPSLEAAPLPSSATTISSPPVIGPAGTRASSVAPSTTGASSTVQSVVFPFDIRPAIHLQNLADFGAVMAWPVPGPLDTLSKAAEPLTTGSKNTEEYTWSAKEEQMLVDLKCNELNWMYSVKPARAPLVNNLPIRQRDRERNWKEVHAALIAQGCTATQKQVWTKWETISRRYHRMVKQLKQTGEGSKKINEDAQGWQVFHKLAELFGADEELKELCKAVELGAGDDVIHEFEEEEVAIVLSSDTEVEDDVAAVAPAAASSAAASSSSAAARTPIAGNEKKRARESVISPLNQGREQSVIQSAKKKSKQEPALEMIKYFTQSDERMMTGFERALERTLTSLARVIQPQLHMEPQGAEVEEMRMDEDL